MNIIPNVLNNPIINRPIIRRPPMHQVHYSVPQMATLSNNLSNNMLIANSEEELQEYVNNNYNNRIVYLRQGDPNTNPRVSVYRIRCAPVLLGEISGIPGETEAEGEGIRRNKKPRKSNKKSNKKPRKSNKKPRKSNKKIIKLSKNTKKSNKSNKSNKKVIKVNKKNNKTKRH